jgi:mucin-2
MVLLLLLPSLLAVAEQDWEQDWEVMSVDPEQDTGLMPEAFQTALPTPEQDSAPATEDPWVDPAVPSEPDVVLTLESAGGTPVALPASTTSSEADPGTATAFMPKPDGSSDSSQVTPEELFTTALPPVEEGAPQPLPVPAPAATPSSQEVVPPSGPGSETNSDTTQETTPAPGGSTGASTVSAPVTKPDTPSSDSTSAPAAGVQLTSAPAAPAPRSSPATPVVDCKRHRRALLAPGADDPCAPAKPVPSPTTTSSGSSSSGSTTTTSSSSSRPPTATKPTVAPTPAPRPAASPKPATPTTTVLPDGFAAGVSVGQATTSVTTSRVTRISAAGVPQVAVGLLVAAAAAAAGLGA